MTKRFDQFTAVDSLDLSIDDGTVFGFLGPNGAGKTTTIKMLVGLIDPTEGTATIAGHDVVHEHQAAKSLLGYMPDHPFLYDYLTPREFLLFLADVRQLGDVSARITELLEYFDLDDKADVYSTNLSYGMKKKLAICGAILHRPKLLILDEPTDGLDPLSVKKFRDLVASLAAEGTTVFLSSHILEVVEKICSRVAIIYKGKIIADGTTAELQARASGEQNLETVFIELTNEANQASKDDRPCP